MTYYLSSIIIVDILMIAMVLHVLNYSGFNRSQKIWFILTYISTAICATAEFAVHGIPYRPIYKTPLTIITIIQFSMAPLIGVFFSGALGLHDQAKKALTVFSLNALVEIILAPLNQIFYFTDSGYNRGPLFVIYEMFYFIALIYLGISMLRAGKLFKHRDKITIIMVMVILLAGILPVTILEVHTAYISIGLAAALCYIYYNDLVQEDIKEDLLEKKDKISIMQENVITGMANLIESRDTETGEHVVRTQQYVNAIAKSAKEKGLYKDELDNKFISLLTRLAPLHDVGKIVVSDTILRKPGKLTPEEYEQMKQHTVKADKVVRQVFNGVTDEDYIKFAVDIATYHHEWWNGKGYPKGLAKEEIPLSARIMALADVYDALISERCYKKAMTKEEAIKIIKSESGTHFDPKLTKVFLEIKDEL